MTERVDRYGAVLMKLISKREAAEILGLHPESVSRLSRTGQFPKPIRTGASQNCRVRYDEAEVTDWLAQRKAAR